MEEMTSQAADKSRDATDKPQKKPEKITTTEVTVFAEQPVGCRLRQPGAGIFRLVFPLRPEDDSPEALQRAKDDALAEAREAFKRLMGFSPDQMKAEFEQTPEAAEATERKREADMKDFGQEPIRDGVMDSGILAFRAFFPNGFTDVSVEPIVKGLPERDFRLTDIFVRIAADGRPFLWIVFATPKAPARREFTEDQTRRIMRLLTDYSFSWCNVYDNRRTEAGTFTFNLNMPYIFFSEPVDGTGKVGQLPRHDLFYGNTFWRLAVRPNEEFLARRAAKAARDAARPPRQRREGGNVEKENRQHRREVARY